MSTSGDRLTDAIHAALPPGIELDEREAALLAAAASQADDLSALEADIRARGQVLEDGRVNPAVREARQGRLTMARLLSGIDLPDSKTFTQLRGRRAAEAKWGNAS
jgi:hypothetical protein